ncbi:MAG: HAMP domain-containing sensor histidine kinase [Pyrinomonadaceae bacterium]
MRNNNLNDLAVLIRHRRDDLLTRWRKIVRQLPIARDLDAPTLNNHLPDLLEELAAELESRPTREEASVEPRVKESPVIHGLERLRVGFDLEEVVVEYNALRNCIQELAESDGLSLEGDAGYIVNRVIDRAIGLAAKTFSEEQARQIQERRQEHLSFVVHDIKTPLSAIHLIAKLLENGLPLEAKTEECKMLLSTLHRNVQRLDELVLKVIEEESDITTEGPIKVERRVIDLWPLVQNLLDDLRPTAEVKMTKLANAVPADATIKADANLLTQIIQNLVGNAIEHTSDGEITVGARVSDEDGALRRLGE